MLIYNVEGGGGGWGLGGAVRGNFSSEVECPLKARDIVMFATSSHERQLRNRELARLAFLY